MNWRKIFTIARQEYATNARRPAFILITLLFPLLGAVALVVMAFFSGQASSLLERQFTDSQAKPVGVVDRSGLYVTIPPSFAGRFVLVSDEEAARKGLLAGQIKTYVVIPSDYIQTGQVTAYVGSSGFMSSASATDSSALGGFLVSGLLAGKVDPALAQRAGSPANVNVVTLDASGKPATGGGLAFVAGFAAPYVFSILLFVSVFASSGYLLRGISEEKETRVIEVILSSVSPAELLTGKVIGLGALGLTQIAIWLLSALLLSGSGAAMLAGGSLILNPSAFLLASLYFLLGYVLYGVTMAAAGALGTNVRESQQLAGIFTFAAAIPWFLAALVFTNPNHILLRILSWIPFTAPTMMMLRLPLTDVPVVDIIGSTVILLITIPIVLWAGAKVFRMGLLMYGKRPSLIEIARTLREA